MNVSNPLNMSAVIAAINANVDSKTSAVQAAVIDDNAANLATTVANTDAEVQAVGDKVDGMTTVNGQLDTNVTAINSNTDSQADGVKTRVTNESTGTKNLVTSEATGVKTHVTDELAALSVSPIKSIQRGVEYLSGAAANVGIAPVDMSKSVVNLCGWYADGTGTSPDSYMVYASLDLAERVYLRRDSSGGQCWVSWEVIEYV